VVYEDAVPPTRLNPSLPPAYDAIFERMLAKDPERRLPTASAFLNALEAHRPAPRVRARAPLRAEGVRAAPRRVPAVEETQDLGHVRWLDVDRGGREGVARLPLSSDPVGAAVFADGVRVGTTPVDVDLDPGSHTIRLLAEGFAPVQLALAVAAGATVPALHVTLDPVLLPARHGDAPAPGADESSPPRFAPPPDPIGRPS
jgi:hypothetical protein